MTPKTTYELTITEKLQHLPLPDQEDAIWARVKNQLDLDLPTDDGGDSGPDLPSGGSGWMRGAGFFGLVAVFITYFLLSKNNDSLLQPEQTIQTQNTPPAVSTNIDQRIDSLPNQVYPERNFDPLSPPGDPPVTTAENGLPILNFDSSVSVPTTSLVMPDTLQRAVISPPVTVLQDTSAPKRKIRGVGGITSDDYRIVPAKKDSL